MWDPWGRVNSGKNFFSPNSHCDIYSTGVWCKHSSLEFNSVELNRKLMEKKMYINYLPFPIKTASHICVLQILMKYIATGYSQKRHARKHNTFWGPCEPWRPWVLCKHLSLEFKLLIFVGKMYVKFRKMLCTYKYQQCNSVERFNQKLMEEMYINDLGTFSHKQLPISVCLRY